MSATYTCDSCGSESATSDYCDMCGAPIAGPPAADEADRPAKAPGGLCYFCGAPRDAEDEVCAVCGVDFVSGQMPAASAARGDGPVDPTPVPADPSALVDAPVDASPAATGTTVLQVPARWTALVGADRPFFDGNVTAGVVAFPDPVVPRQVDVTGSEVSIGRRSESKGYQPDIDLSGPIDDPAVSRRHAVLRRLPDSSLAVVDVGSTNGTWVNDDDDPLAENVPRILSDGDRILLGAFTCITVRRDPPGGEAPPDQPA